MYAQHASQVTAIQTVTTKVPPSYDGRSSWFAYEEAVDNWLDVTELEPEKWGPALRNRLEGEAAAYAPLLYSDALKIPDGEGVNYFKRHLRQHFVKGSQSVFLWRFLQLFKSYRGQQQDMLRWLGRIQVMRNRLRDAWMDLFEPPDENNPHFRAHTQRQELQALMTQNGPAAMLAQCQQKQRDRHEQRMPLSDNLFALTIVALVDLQESQRGRFSSTMSLRGQTVSDYTFQDVREVMIELCCAPKSSIDNPSLRSVTAVRSFCVLDDGEMEGQDGYWVQDDETEKKAVCPSLMTSFGHPMTMPTFGLPVASTAAD